MQGSTNNGPWSDALAQLREWDPAWAATCERMSTLPWRSGVLTPRLAELVGLAVNAACTNLNAEGTRRHIRGALDAGASRDEVLMVLKMASLMALHSCSLGAPILLEEAQAAGAGPALACPRRAVTRSGPGAWNSAWDPFFQLDPASPTPTWPPVFYASGVLPAKEVELLSIARRVSPTCTRRARAATSTTRCRRCHGGRGHGGAGAVR